MLLYALYTPKKPTSWKREKAYAFCSIERYVHCMRQKEFSRELKPITKDELLNQKHFTLANLYIGEKGDSNGFAPDFINIREDGMQSTFDGKYIPVELVEKMVDERVPHNVTYP